MIKTKTVLVLGAGASAPYCYPVGRELRRQIFHLRSLNRFGFAKSAGLRTGKSYLDSIGDDLDDFVRAFEFSQAESIDAFLAHRTKFADIGKRAIASILLEAENVENLFSNEPEDHWYQYLLRYIAEKPWDEIDLSNLSIVTFNYDRSFEYYIVRIFMERSGKGRNEVVEKLKEQLKIVHVYGALGSSFPETENALEKFGDGVSEERVFHAAASILVIPEGRDEHESLVEARRLLDEAQSIAFLGFGFDKTNLLRLHAEKTCLMQPARRTQRRIMATCFGLTNAERRAAFRLTAGSVSSEDFMVNRHFFNANCTTMLRESLFFE